MTDTSTAAPVPFANLHVHTEYSLLDGMASTDTFDYLASIGQNAVAITDHGTLAGLWKMTEAGRKHNIKVLAGLESYVAVGSRFDRDYIEIPADDSSADEGDGKSGTGEKASTSDALTLDQLSEEERAQAIQFVAMIEDLLASDDGDISIELIAGYAQLSETSAAFRGLPSTQEGTGDAEGKGQPVTLDDALVALASLRETFLAPPRKVKKRFHEHLTLIATNETGWSNLLALSNAAELSKHQGKPRIDLQLLAEHHEGLVILTGCLGGAFLGSLSRGDRNRASDTLRRLVEIAGTDRVFVEVMEHGIDAESRVLPEAAKLAAEHGVRMVATNDAHYVRPDADTAHAAWLAHQSKSTLANPKYAFHGAGFHLASEAEMRAKRPEQWWQDAVTTAGEIAALASGDVLPESKIRLPKFPLPDGEADTTAYFVRLINEGATRIYGPDRPAEVSARLQEEFSVVAQMGMTDYFLIVADMMAWARAQGILTGPGRGSAAGSLISYCLGIVTIDPLEHNLLFERFLEPGRKGMPDIDSDFEAARRDEVFAYLGRKYGNEFVARIGTFGFARTKKAIKDAARVLELTRVGDTLAKEVPIDAGKPLTFAKLRDPARADAESFRSAVAVGGEDAARVVELAEAFEDLVSTLGVHACGFLVSDVPVAELVPVRVNEDGLRYTAWDGRDVEALGLCKIDILGLKNLDGLAKAFEYLREFEGIELAHDEIPHPNTKGDPRVDATYRLLREGKTSGVFQLESDGITALTADIKPENWDDLSAILALYRPGPMGVGMHLHYGARKHGLEPIEYGHLTTDPTEIDWISRVLGTTYAIASYQEQIMELGRVIAGFDAAERSKLRKAIGKKIKSEMDAIGLSWVQRATQEYRDETGELISPAFSVATAERLWETIKVNADYLFNKCLTGETVTMTSRGVGATIEDLYYRIHGGKPVDPSLCDFCGERPAGVQKRQCKPCRSWAFKFRDPKRGNTLLAYDFADGRIRPERIVDVHQNGVKPVFRISLADGKTVRATSNHRFLSPNGWREVRELRPGAELIVDVGYELQMNHPSNRTTIGERESRPDRKPWLPGEQNSGYVNGGFMALKTWTARTIDTAACKECGIGYDVTRLERAHLDGNRTNNDPSNLAWMCVSHHKQHDYRENGRRRRWDKGHLAVPVRIISIEPDGLEMTYDVEMDEGTSHSFTANGIVSHNSHSVAYARTTFDTAYVKANWPAAYGAALLATVDDTDRRVRIIEGVTRDGVEVLPPEVNRSGASTQPEGTAVRLGLGEIKDAGSDAEGLIRAREAHGGAFPDLPSIYRAIDPTANRATLGKRMLEALVEAGAMDEYGPRLGINVVSRALATAPFPVPQLEWSTLERAIRQRARIGISFGTHPLVLHQNEVRSWVPEGTMNPEQFRASLLPVQALPDVNGARISTLALLASVSTRAYRGGKLAQLTLEGSSARINGVMWNDRLAEHLDSPQGLPPAGALVLARGRVSIREVEIEDRESGEVSTTIQRELTVSYLEEIRVADDGTYRLPDAPSMGIRFPSTEDLDVLAEAAADAEATGAAQAAEAARLEQLQQAQLEVAAREAELAEHATVPLVDVRTGAAVPVVAVDANLSSAMVRLRLRNAGFAIDLDLAAQIAAGEVRVSELQGFPIRDDRTGDVVAYVVASPEEPTPDDADASVPEPAPTSAAHSAGEPADSTLLEGAIS